ncbi:MAG: flagellar assembly protein FliX [Pseudomonadota bacterium]
MKVDGPTQTQKTDKAKSAKKAGKTDGTFGAMVTGGAKETSGAIAPGSVAAVDALLAVQAAEDPTERAARGRMRERADTLLNKLDEIRLSLLTGNMSVGQVIGVADVVASHREAINDPKLAGILDEIDLRAQIEIAKMRKAMGGTL